MSFRNSGNYAKFHMSYGLKEIAADVIRGKIQFSEKTLAEERIIVCERCEHFKKISRQCGQCGCFVDAKVKFLHSGCPINKW